MRELDFGAGEILKQLSRLGLANNTLVLFSSDNGAAKIGETRGEFLHLARSHRE